MERAVILSAKRTANARAFKGSFAQVRSDTLGAAAVRAAVDASGVADADVDDVLIGCAMTEGPQGLNLGRQIGVLAGLPDSVAGATVNRFCASSAVSVGLAATSIQTGQADVIVAGGAESMSMIPMAGLTPELYPNPKLFAERPGFYLPMGLTAENVAKAYNISREDQDAFGVRSHNRAEAAAKAGVFAKQIIDVEGCAQDEGIRPGATYEATSQLRPVFRENGTVTAGNASQMSDGAGALVLASESYAEAHGLKPLGHVEGAAVAGVAAETMGIGPVPAVQKLLQRKGWSVDDFAQVELNEAFAAQALAVIRELGLDEDCTNPEGGAIALGHPLGATGSRLSTHLVHQLQGKDAMGLVTMCVGGGQGYALALHVY